LWNLVEGYFSRNREAYIPSLAEFLGLPYVGSDSYAQSLSLDKYLTKQIALDCNLPVADSYLLNLEDEFRVPSGEWFLKPNGEGSSLAIQEDSILKSQKDFEKARESISIDFYPLLVEEYLSGREYTVGILGESKKLFPTQVAEIFVPSRVYDQSIKTKSEMPETLVPLEDPVKAKWIQKKSLDLAERLGVSGYARMDWKEDASGNPYFLEANLTPGLSYHYSSLPICARFSGIEYNVLLRSILDWGLLDFSLKSRSYGRAKFPKKMG
jgi:D-alanine-D-alanine ligase